MNVMRKFVQRNLQLNKKRAVVTVIGIILSVALLSALSSMTLSFQKSLVVFEKEKSGDFHAGFSHVSKENLPDFDNNRAIESYFTISELGYGIIPESKNDYKPYCRLVGTDDNGMERARFKLIEGRFPKNENEIVIPRHLKTNGRVSYKVGDKLSFQIGNRVSKSDNKPLYYTALYTGDNETLINLVDREFEVVGIIERPSNSFENYECPGYTFVTYSEELAEDFSIYARFKMENLRQYERTVAGIMGVDPDLMEKYANYELNDEEMQMIIDQFAQCKYELISGNRLAQYERVWPIDRTFTIVLVLAGIVAAIIIFTSVYCIKNSFEISINEKIRQYGMLSSIGATKKQIKKSVHTEAAILGCFGIPIGLVSGLLAAFVLIKVSNYFLRDNIQFDLVFYPSVLALLVAVILGAVTIYFSAAGSARKAGRVSPMEAIRNQNEISITAKNVRAPRYVGKLFGIGGVVSYKNIKRNKKKYRTTVVSIAICTITFIVISYFMSMLSDLTSFAYSGDRCNLSCNVYLSEGGEFDTKQMTNLEDYDEVEVVRTRFYNLDKYTFTKDYEEYMDNASIEDIGAAFIVMALDEESFMRYAKECGLVNADGKVIFVNNNKVIWYEDDDKMKNADIKVYDVKEGEYLSLYLDDESAGENELSGENEAADENEVVGANAAAGENKDRLQIEIGKITDVRPMGYVANKMDCFLVMSDSTAEKYGVKFNGEYGFYYVSSNPDKLEDDVENVINSIEDSNAGYSLNNRDKNQKQEQSLFILFNIFAYGLIIVIALIGITNIVNTLNTSMELRSREFATLRSVGMTDKQYNKMVVLESVFTAGKSLLIGVVIGILITLGIHWVEVTYDTVFPYRPPVAAILLAIVVVMLLIYAIIRSAMNRIIKRNIIETIKNENL